MEKILLFYIPVQRTGKILIEFIGDYGTVVDGHSHTSVGVDLHSQRALDGYYKDAKKPLKRASFHIK
jgi:hypothetical protein